MSKEHYYNTTVRWTGNTGDGTSSYKAYERSHNISIDGKSPIEGSSDPAFRGDRTKYNPEELVVAALSSCHMLWYLHLCADNGIVVTSYTDAAKGIMKEESNGSGQFTNVTLYPRVSITDHTKTEKAKQLHEEAHKMCFIARSVNFSVQINSEIKINTLTV